MTKKGKYLLGILIGIIFIFGCEELFRRRIGGFAGSYPFAETWEINASEKEVIDAIIELKRENPNLQPPNQTELTHGRDTGYVKEWLDEEKLIMRKDSTYKIEAHYDSNSYGDSTNSWTNYWYDIDFYYSDTKEIVHTWTRPNLDSTITTFAFVSLNEINKPNEYQFINRDFWYIPNKIQISKFKESFVDKIKDIINKKRKSST